MLCNNTPIKAAMGAAAIKWRHDMSKPYGSYTINSKCTKCGSKIRRASHLCIGGKIPQTCTACERAAKKAAAKQ